MSQHGNHEFISVVEPVTGWSLLDIRELVDYRDLFFFLVWRDIKVLYAQTVLGFLWAILNPVVQIIVFTIIFGKLAKLPTDGIPYVLFSTVGVIPWTYMSESMGRSSQSLVSGQGMLGKVYFPRLIYPLTAVLAKLVDFTVSMVLVVLVLIWYQVPMTWNLLVLPLFIPLMMAVPAAIGLWLSSLAIRFRDVKFAMPFILRMLIYTAPVLFAASAVPDDYRLLFALNPLVAVIEGFRSCLLGWIFRGT
jgi:lipopolysaccharide transport system permease protein